MITTWGYSLTELETLPELLTFEDYNTFTGGQYASDQERIEKEIAAASAAVRNFVGWHLGPSASCQLNTIATDRRIIRTGRDYLIQLPARYVTEVESVEIGGASYQHFVCDPAGILRVYDVAPVERWAPVVIDYTAGLSSALMAPIEELIAYRVTHSIAVPAGITSEASGGVSVTYNAAWINNSRATAIVDDNREMLIPYKVTGVF